MNSLLSDKLSQWVVSPNNTEIDALLRAALDSYKDGLDMDGTVSSMSVLPMNTSLSLPFTAPIPGPTHGSSNKRLFTAPKSDNEVVSARAKGVPLKLKYCVCLWEAWRDHRSPSTGKAISNAEGCLCSHNARFLIYLQCISGILFSRLFDN